MNVCTEVYVYMYLEMEHKIFHIKIKVCIVGLHV